MKDIFRTLKNYSKGFCEHNSENECRIYNEKVKEITERIKNDVEHAPEIIAEEFAKIDSEKFRAWFSGEQDKYISPTSKYKAIDNVLMCLLDSKPLKK